MKLLRAHGVWVLAARGSARPDVLNACEVARHLAARVARQRAEKTPQRVSRVGWCSTGSAGGIGFGASLFKLLVDVADGSLQGTSLAT